MSSRRGYGGGRGNRSARRRPASAGATRTYNHYAGQYQTKPSVDKTPRRQGDMYSARSDVNFKTPRTPQARPQSAGHSRYSQNAAYARTGNNSGMMRPRSAANLRSALHGPRSHRRHGYGASVHEFRQARYMRPPITTDVIATEPAPSRQGQESEQRHERFSVIFSECSHER